MVEGGEEQEARIDGCDEGIIGEIEGRGGRLKEGVPGCDP